MSQRREELSGQTAARTLRVDPGPQIASLKPQAAQLRPGQRVRIGVLLGLALLTSTRYSQAQSSDWSEGSPKADQSKGLFGPFRIGPLVGFGLPNLINFGVTLKLTRYFGAGVNFGLIPQVRISYYGEAQVSYQEYDAYARVFPFGGGFFLGSGVGYAHARGSFRKDTDISDYAAQYPALNLPRTLSSTSQGSVQSMVLTPQLGYFQIFRGGFCAGADVGLQIPIAKSRTELDTRVQQSVPEQAIERVVGPGEAEVRDTLKSVARTPIPTFNFRIGWML
ncbi:MAG TPA: hypothetical protein VFQ61_29215 [Polyangiaceae bacterium]|nr:hypothetical protein [Polyangiaceae bacterium]